MTHDDGCPRLTGGDCTCSAAARLGWDQEEDARTAADIEARLRERIAADIEATAAPGRNRWSESAMRAFEIAAHIARGQQ